MPSSCGFYARATSCSGANRRNGLGLERSAECTGRERGTLTTLMLRSHPFILHTLPQCRGQPER